MAEEEVREVTGTRYNDKKMLEETENKGETTQYGIETLGVRSQDI